MYEKQSEEYERLRNLKGLKSEDVIFINFHVNRDLYDILVEESKDTSVSLEQLILNILALNMTIVDEIGTERETIACDRCQKEINLKAEDSLVLQNTFSGLEVKAHLCYMCSKQYISAYNECSRKRKIGERNDVIRK